MLHLKIGIILTSNPRSQAYIQKILNNNISIDEIIFLNDNQPNIVFKNEEIEKGKKYGFDLSKSVHSSLIENKLDFTEFKFADINNPELIKFLSKSDCHFFIFSGGGILKDQILNIGKKFIHFHPGIVPNYRGSTCFYYSIINEKICGVTSFFMDKNLDTGKIILQKIFDSPNHEFMDNVYDPHIRSETMIEVVQKKYFESKNSQEQPSKGETYYIIHPVLKHIAILSCLND
jgi:methionyl-tRNA formyltransferase